MLKLIGSVRSGSRRCQQRTPERTTHAHSGTRMAERHYAHLAPSYVADTIRRTAPDLSIPQGSLISMPRPTVVQA